MPDNQIFFVKIDFIPLTFAYKFILIFHYLILNNNLVVSINIKFGRIKIIIYKINFYVKYL